MADYYDLLGVSRDADAEVHVPTVLEFLRDAPRDAVLVQHGSIQM